MGESVVCPLPGVRARDRKAEPQPPGEVCTATGQAIYLTPRGVLSRKD